ncbi:hypothetical protein FRC06_001067 [Ceratobasidium sp. 370]|nr:hypothetical protein FRC06_001067 [Ceratobasidium sp. 370]
MGAVANRQIVNCRIWILTGIFVELFTLFSATFLIGMRVHILWDNRRNVFTLVSAAWMLHVAANVILVAIFCVANNAGTYRVEVVANVCTGSVVNSWIVWIPVMLYHCFIMGLLVTKSLSTPRQVRSSFVGNFHSNLRLYRSTTTRIHDVMIRDGFSYFFAVFIALLFNLLSWALAPPTLAALPRDIVWAICTTATSRLLLSLKGIQGAQDWDNANNIARRDIELQPQRRVKFIFTEHEDDLGSPEIPRKASVGLLKMTTLGRFEN